ncbi:hypothetical protein SAMN05443377_10597 [Propionibacterium cyclohexanicum]|uniref:O-antigen ligase like membrane protein n=2 Tax=Propionibacterium cyclohexanicum TaxID=64702 RepID=A0A1H9R3C3_9ACTN|nr:hypothetical protein SAMN05443377_10597 [Propionibacterium cyclohexanicum]
MGWISILAGMVALVLGRLSLYFYALAISAVFLNLPAIQVTATSVIPPFFILGAMGVVIVPVIAKRKQRLPAPDADSKHIMNTAVLFCVYSCFTAVFLPLVMANTPVLLPSAGIDAQVADPSPLQLSIQNFAQSAYVILGTLVIFQCYRYWEEVTKLVSIMMMFGVAINLAQYLLVQFTPLSFRSLLQLNVGEDYGSTVGDVVRFSGIYGEPSYLATFAICAVGFFLIEFGRSRSFSSGALHLAFACASIALVWLSSSGTAFLSLIGVGVAIALYGLVVFIRSHSVRIRVILVILLGLCVIVGLSGTILGRFSLIFADKTSSDSFINRNASNDFSVTILRNTLGFGVGLGSSRPSSFLMALLSNVGIIGTIIFAILIARTLFKSFAIPSRHSTAFALISLLIAKVIAEPNISLPLMWMLLAVSAVPTQAPHIMGVPGDAIPSSGFITRMGVASRPGTLHPEEPHSRSQ